MKTLIIAEAGINHNRSIHQALALVDAAKEAGADVVKFQLENPTQFTLTWEQQAQVYRYCQDIGMRFACTAFDVPSLEYLLEHTKMDFVKVASRCIDKGLLRRVGKVGLPMIVSTGACGLRDVEVLIETIIGRPYREENLNMVLMHCVSAYPAPYDATQLRAMATMKKHFLLPVGFSDHSIGIEVPVAAVALGARAIEKHITLDREEEGPDHKCSLEPDDFRTMVFAIRNIEKALGDGIKQTQTCEAL